MKLTKYILISTMTALLLSSCGEKKEEKVKAEVIRPVKYQVIGTSDGLKVRTFSGVVKAGNEIELSFRSSGIITALNAKVGQKVKKGDLIAKLDNVQAKLAYEQAISALKSAKSAMNTAKLSLDRIKSLYEKGSNSLSDYEKAKNSYQSALDQYESAKRKKDIQKTEINYGYIYAPSNGIIASKSGGLNENTSAGQVVAVLNAGKQTNIEVGLPENVINKVVSGMTTALNFSAINGEEFTGTVIEISPIVGASSATYPVKVSIDQVSEAIKPGMTASVTFNFGGNEEEEMKEKPLIVPVKAVGEDDKGNFVFIIKSTDNKTGTVEKQHIKLGELTGEGFTIISGLKQGDLIATAGLQTLLSGQKVKLQ